MAERPNADVFAALPLFAGLTEDELARLATMASYVSAPAGTALFQEGDPKGDLFVLLEGRVTLCMRVDGRADTCFLSLRAGELVGWSALLGRPRVATVRVVQPSKLLRLAASDLLELCESDHRIGYALMRQAFEAMADRLHTTRLQLLDIFGKPAS